MNTQQILIAIAEAKSGDPHIYKTYLPSITKRKPSISFSALLKWWKKAQAAAAKNRSKKRGYTGLKSF